MAQRLIIPLGSVILLMASYAHADSGGYTHVFSPHAVYLADSGWTAELIEKQFARVQEIYDQCHLRVQLKEIRQIQGSSAWLNLAGQADFEIADSLGLTERPIVVFVNSAGGSGGYSHGDEFTPDSPSRTLTDISWIGAIVLGEAYKQRVDASYNTVAHELAHVLCNCGHVPAGVHNLLAGPGAGPGEPSLVNDRLTNEQCETFRHSPLVTPRFGM